MPWKALQGSQVKIIGQSCRHSPVTFGPRLTGKVDMRVGTGRSVSWVTSARRLRSRQFSKLSADARQTEKRKTKRSIYGLLTSGMRMYVKRNWTTQFSGVSTWRSGTY